MILVSWNIAGLQDKEKLGDLVRILHSLSAQIILLQEVHLPSSSLPLLQLLWKGSVVLSPDPDHPTARNGVLILIKEGIELVSSQVHIPGRVISAVIKINGEDFWIANIYAPADVPLQPDFFSALPPPPVALIERCLIGGDWNCLPHRIDKIGGAPAIHNRCPPSLLDYQANSDLVDIWRFQHPEEKDASCFSVRSYRGQNVLIGSRLDRWMVSSALSLRCESQIRHDVIGVPSDHRPVQLVVNPAIQVERGPGYWMLNTSVLTLTDYLTLINEFLDSAPAEQDSFTNILDWWDWIKETIKTLSIEFCSQLSKKKKKEEALLTKAVLAAKRNWTADPNNTSLRLAYSAASDALQTHQQHKLEGVKTRSRINWMEKGGKPTKYFFSLEKKKGEDRTISSLLTDDGTLVTAPAALLDTAAGFYRSLYSPSVLADRPLAQTRILQNITARVPEFEMPTLEANLSLEEVTQAVKSSANNKTPGPDGIPIDFYKVFWKKIKKNAGPCSPVRS